MIQKIWNRPDSNLVRDSNDLNFQKAKLIEEGRQPTFLNDQNYLCFFVLKHLYTGSCHANITILIKQRTKVPNGEEMKIN